MTQNKEYFIIRIVGIIASVSAFILILNFNFQNRSSIFNFDSIQLFFLSTCLLLVLPWKYITNYILWAICYLLLVVFSVLSGIMITFAVIMASMHDAIVGYEYLLLMTVLWLLIHNPIVIYRYRKKDLLK